MTVLDSQTFKPTLRSLSRLLSSILTLSLKMSDSLKPLLRSIIQFTQTYHQEQPNQNLDHQNLSPFLNDLQQFLKLLTNLKIQDDLNLTTQIASLLTSLSISGLDQDSRVLTCSTQEIRKHWSLPLLRSTSNQPVCDIVGTGGDGFNTFNVSTAAAIVAAGAGLQVCKVNSIINFTSTIQSLMSLCC